MSRLVSVNIETGSASLEGYAAMQEGLYYMSHHRVEFNAWMPEDKIMVMDKVIHIPEKHAYKFFFMNNQVNDMTVRFAINHAVCKINRFIDNYKV